MRNVLILNIVVLGFMFFAGNVANAQYNVSDCIRDRLIDGRTCTLCGSANAPRESECEILSSPVYDDETCMCVEASVCSSYTADQIEATAQNCYEQDGIWSYKYCQCRSEKDGMRVINATAGGGTKGGQNISSLFDGIFFKSNFDGSVDNISELIRLALIVVFMIIAIVAFFIGIYGMAVYSTARDNEEQVKKAQKIFKNALMGLAISVLGVVIVQVVAILFNVSDGLFDFSFNISSP